MGGNGSDLSGTVNVREGPLRLLSIFTVTGASVNNICDINAYYYIGNHDESIFFRLMKLFYHEI